MRFYLLSDNTDTVVGMRFAGVEGIVVHEKEEFLIELNRIMDYNDVGVILVTKKLVSLCREEIYQTKLTRTLPLIVEIPDRHGNAKISESITYYVQNAIGLKL